MNDDLPLASDEAHAALYALLADAYDERDGDADYRKEGERTNGAARLAQL